VIGAQPTFTKKNRIPSYFLSSKVRIRSILRLLHHANLSIAQALAFIGLSPLQNCIE
jgi:hypothetical protein